MSALLTAVDQAALRAPGGGLVLALAHAGPRELKLDRRARRT